MELNPADDAPPEGIEDKGLEAIEPLSSEEDQRTVSDEQPEDMGLGAVAPILSSQDLGNIPGIAQSDIPLPPLKPAGGPTQPTPRDQRVDLGSQAIDWIAAIIKRVLQILGIDARD